MKAQEDALDRRFIEAGMIETVGLTREFDGRVAVKGLTLNVGEGEVFGFLGPNGAGKTTTVRMLTCLIAPSSGEATVNGLRVGIDDRIIRRQVGLLTEVPGLYESLSAYQNLRFYADLYQVTDHERQIERYLRMLDLWDRRNDTVARFSKGMKQKLAIARALVHEPRVLFLDEPTAGLDPEAALVVRDFISELRRERRTIFLCTHNLDEAERLCDRIAVIRSELIAVDTPENLRRSLFGRKTVIRLSTVTPEYSALLRELPFVQQIESNENRLTITVSDPVHDNPLLVETLVRAGARIQFVEELKHSLEEVYLTLLKGAEQ